jgi:hypothetical protein
MMHRMRNLKEINEALKSRKESCKQCENPMLKGLHTCEKGLQSRINQKHPSELSDSDLIAMVGRENRYAVELARRYEERLENEYSEI